MRAVSSWQPCLMWASHRAKQPGWCMIFRVQVSSQIYPISSLCSLPISLHSLWLCSSVNSACDRPQVLQGSTPWYDQDEQPAAAASRGATGEQAQQEGSRIEVHPSQFIMHAHQESTLSVPDLDMHCTCVALSTDSQRKSIMRSCAALTSSSLFPQSCCRLYCFVEGLLNAGAVQ